MLHLFFGRFLKTNAFRYIGKWSYSIYLVHFQIIFWARACGKESGFDGAIFILMSAIGTGFLLFTLVERPSYQSAKHIINLIERCFVFVNKRIQKKDHLKLTNSEAEISIKS